MLVLAGIIFGLHGMLSRVRPHDILAALIATPPIQVLHALGLLAASFCVMLVYDVPGVLFARKLVSVPRLGFRQIALASFCAYALSHILGAAAITAAAIRVRLYAEWKVPPSGIARIAALSGTMFSLGAAALAGAVLLFRPFDLPLFGRSISTDALRLIGALLWAAILFYVVIARRTRPFVLWGRNIPLPGLPLATAQVVISTIDIAIAGTILFTMLPDTPGLTLPHVLAIYLAAFAGGLFSSLPAGVGVFDTLLLLGLSGYLGPADAIGAILLFRVLYYLIPAGVAGLCFAGHEIFLTTKGNP